MSGGGPDIGQMLKQAQGLQAKMAELQQRAATMRFEADAGGGMVRVVASGDLRIVEIHVEPTLIDAKDREMIEDLTAAAVNAALRKAQEGVQAEVQRLGGGLDLGGLMRQLTGS
jgi:DNA-binding YbaB/EbfC family protein